MQLAAQHKRAARNGRAQLLQRQRAALQAAGGAGPEIMASVVVNVVVCLIGIFAASLPAVRAVYLTALLGLGFLLVLHMSLTPAILFVFLSRNATESRLTTPSHKHEQLTSVDPTELERGGSKDASWGPTLRWILAVGLVAVTCVGCWGIGATRLRQRFLREDILAESSYSYGFYRATSQLFSAGQLPVHVVMKGVDMADSRNLPLVNQLRAAVTSSPYIDAYKVSMSGIDDWYCNWDPRHGCVSEVLDGRDNIGAYWQTYLSFLNNSDPGGNNCGVFCELSPECNATKSGLPGDFTLLPGLPVDPTTGVPVAQTFRKAFHGKCLTVNDWSGQSFLQVFTKGCGPDGKSGLCGSYWLQDLVMKDQGATGEVVTSQLRAFQKSLDPADIQAELDAIDDIEAKINEVRFPDGGEAFPQAYVLLVFGQLKQIRIYAVAAAGIGLLACWLGMGWLVTMIQPGTLAVAMLIPVMVCIAAIGLTVLPQGLNISLTQASIVPMLGLPLLLLLTFCPSIAEVDKWHQSKHDEESRWRSSEVEPASLHNWEAVSRGQEGRR